MAELQDYVQLFFLWLLSTIAIRAILTRKKNKTPRLPSPPSLPIIGHLHLISKLPHQSFHNLSTKYGPIMQIYLGSKPCVVVSSPQIAKEFLKTHEASFLNRFTSSAVHYLSYGSKGFLFAPYGEYWRFMKKLCMSELLGSRTINQLLPLRQQEQVKFLRLLQKKGEAGEAVERVISEHQVERKRRKENGEGDINRDILDILLGIYEDDNTEVKLTRVNIKAFILDLFMAGTDTSAITTEWALAELINNPRLMKKAREEIDSVTAKTRLIEESDLPNLPYLRAIVRETLRIHPTSPFIMRESSESCNVCGYEIPSKSVLFVNLWSMGRDSNLWENPLEFRPERFTTKDNKLDVRGQNFQLIPFGTGRRMCPGTSLALQVVPINLASLIQCFDWKIDGDNNGIVNMEEKPAMTLPRAHPLYTRYDTNGKRKMLNKIDVNMI